MILFSHGRTSLYYGLLRLNIKNKNKIFLPNYICKSLLVPIVKLNIDYLFYDINDDFSFDLNKIKNRINPGDCLLVVHYFGYPQNLKLIIDFCKKKKLKLIEDNSHGYSGKYKKKEMGTFGLIGISSPRKILKTTSGGVLYFKKKKITCNLNKYSVSKFIFLKNFLGKLSFYRYLKRKFYNTSKFYIKSIDKFENSFFDNSADIKSNRIFNNSDWVLIGKERRKRWVRVVEFFKKKKCYPIWKYPAQDTCPWLIPFYAKNKSQRDSLISWGERIGIKTITWPNLPIFKSRIDSLRCRKIWNKLFCVELDNDINEKLKLSQ